MSARLRAPRRTELGRDGFTLVETLVTLVIVAVVGAALFQILTASKVNVEDQKATLEAQQNARVALTAIAEDFRHVSYGKDQTQPSIAYADFDSVVFVADIFDAPGAETISYYLSPDGDSDTPNPNDTILMKTVSDTTGAVLVDAPQSYGIAASGLQLRYFTGDNNELTVPVDQPETIGEIRVLVSGVSPTPLRDGNYLTVTLSTTIYPRNRPLTPARARPNPPASNGANIPNCEAVTIRWIAPTANTDGSDLPLTDISHFNFYLTVDGGDRALNARLNRTITERTVSELEAGHQYTFEVTAVSRAGVESYPMTRVIDLVTGLLPEAVTDLQVEIEGSDANLSWSGVDLFTDGSSIVTPVYYEVHQGDTPGFVVDDGSQIGQTVDWQTVWSVTGLADCEETYFKVVPVACANEGDPSAAVRALAPAIAACPTDITADHGSTSGEIAVAWTAPTTRLDGTPLSPDDIAEYRVYVDTTDAVGPGSPVDIVSAGVNSVTVTVPGCDTYYVNVAAVDQCGSVGDLCPQNEVTVAAGAPCTPGAPSVPTSLAQNAGDTSVQLTWDANTEDCDLAGYRIWYGHSPGGPYNGTGAVEGNSPITLDAEAVTIADLATFALSGLSGCATYYVAVTAYDVCEPFEESGYSDEIVVDTACQPCDIALTCSPVYSAGASHNEVTMGLFSSAADQGVETMKLGWSGSQRLVEVWVDDSRVWSADGADGADGSQLPVPAGTLITPDPFTVDGSSTEAEGHRMDLVFDADMRGEDVFIDFRTQSGPCSVMSRVSPSILLDDFDDNDYGGWTVQTGNWSVSSGKLKQGNDAGVFQWLHTSVLTHDGDFVLEADMKITTGGYSLVQFNRDASDSRYMTYLSAWSGEGHIGRMTASYTDFGWGYGGIAEGEWYRTKVVREGDVFKLYANCQLIAEAAAYPSPPAGRFGFGAYYSKIEVDDVVIVDHDAGAQARY